MRRGCGEQEREEIPLRYRGSQFPRQVSPVSLANDLSQITGPGALANQQRSPALPKCRSLQLEALSAGDVARAPLTAGASYCTWPGLATSEGSAAPARAKRAMRLVRFSGSTACVYVDADAHRPEQPREASGSCAVLSGGSSVCACGMQAFAHTCCLLPSIKGMPDAVPLTLCRSDIPCGSQRPLHSREARIRLCRIEC